MLSFLDNCGNASQGTIQFLYHDNGNAPMPLDYSDPLTLLGDLSMLGLSRDQLDKLRDKVRADLHREGPEEIWRTRSLRKNVIHSFGTIV